MSLTRSVSITKLKELALKRPANDAVRQVILGFDDQLDPDEFCSLVKLCLRIMSQKRSQAVAVPGSENPKPSGG